jgi:hypothetical protein
LLPTPGNRVKACTASSISFDGYSIPACFSQFSKVLTSAYPSGKFR